ncbi:transposase [Methylomagnum sp.]
MRGLVDAHYPRTRKIRMVQDNLNTHDGASLYGAFPPAETRRLLVLDRIEWRYTPKHGSWVNMAETEIGIMNAQCLDRRLESPERIAVEGAAWEARRNAAQARIHWCSPSRRRGASCGSFTRQMKMDNPLVQIIICVRKLTHRHVPTVPFNLHN